MMPLRNSTWLLLFLYCSTLFLFPGLVGQPSELFAGEYQTERAQLTQELTNPRQGEAISDTHVIDAMSEVPRHLFVREQDRHRAYDNRPLSIGHGQTISQPYIVALMTEMLTLNPESRALEIGTGSGYQAAVLAEITENVYSIEIIPELAEWGQDNLVNAEYTNVEVKSSDGYHGWEEHAPFDAIIVTAAASHIPPPLLDQLAEGGRMVIPVGPPFQTQVLMLVEKTEDGEIRQESTIPVRFVPFTRADDE